MLPEFDKNAGYLWTIVAIGVIVPVLLSLYAGLRARAAKARLERLQNQDEEA